MTRNRRWMLALSLAVFAASSGCGQMQVGMEEPKTKVIFKWPTENWNSPSGLVELSLGQLRSSDSIVRVTSSAREMIDGRDYLGIELYGHDGESILKCVACPIETPYRHVDIRLTLDRRLPATLHVEAPAGVSLFNADGDVNLGREAELGEGNYRLMLKIANEPR